MTDAKKHHTDDKAKSAPATASPGEVVSKRIADVTKWWTGLSQQNKLIYGGGAALLVIVLIAALANSGGSTYQGYGPYARGYPGAGYANGGYQGGGYPGGGGYTAYPGQAGGGYTANGGGQTDDDPTGYWARQRAQDQSAQSFDNYIRDQNAVQDNNTGQVYTEVPNTVADPAIESGQYSQVPTPELPTSEPEPAPAE